MKKLLFGWFFLLCLNALYCQKADFAFQNVHLIDMTSAEIKADQTVLIAQGKIIAIGASDEIDVSQSKQIIDGSGKYLMPGLAEMHAHIPGKQDMDLLEETLFLYLSNGITTIRGMLGQPYHLELREQVISKEILGPRIYTSGPSINGNSVRTIEEGESKVKAQQAAGYDFLKLHPGLSRENFDAVVATANEVGIPYAGHVSTAVGVRRALEAKYASIDHVDGYMEGLVPENIRVNPNTNGFFGINFTDIADESQINDLVIMTKANGVWIVPTQAMMERWVGPDNPKVLAKNPEMKYMNPKTVENWVNTKMSLMSSPNYDVERAMKFNQIRRDVIKQLHEGGVNIILGSDAPQVFNVPGFSIQREMEAMSRSGLSNFDVLKSGTSNPAIFFDQQGMFGTVVQGADADLILVDENPFEDLEAMKKQSGVMVRGTWLSQEMIDKRLDQIAQKYAN